MPTAKCRQSIANVQQSVVKRYEMLAKAFLRAHLNRWVCREVTVLMQPELPAGLAFQDSLCLAVVVRQSVQYSV